MKNKLYVINGKTYLSHINDEVHLYGFLHQLAFLAGRIKDEEDVFHVLDTAKRYGEIAEEKFQSWGIPGRYLVFGDRWRPSLRRSRSPRSIRMSTLSPAAASVCWWATSIT